jgi:hypothetical protein
MSTLQGIAGEWFLDKKDAKSDLNNQITHKRVHNLET